jgi:phosphoserine aminotransferase
MKRAHNFSAGPAILPIPVLEATSQAVVDFNNNGMSIMEMSHRSKEYDEVFVDAQKSGLKILGLSPDEYDVLFLGGGASMQFIMIPMNFLVNKADYLNTGQWAKNAIKEAKFVGNVNVIASSEDTTFNYIPKDYKINPDSDYLHFTTNNTIYGTRFTKMPESGIIPLVADMSSDFMSRELDYSKYDMIYAGAQKNIGPAGVTMVIIRKEFAAKAKENVPTMLKYKTHIDKDSMFNTPPCVNVYVVGQVFKWIEAQGGLAAIEANNIKKAGVLYDFMDANSDYYKGTVINKEDRSLMNICWNLPSPELEAKFIAEAKTNGMTNLKGHRSVGGIRASVYNACPISSVEALVKFMESFKKAN